MDSQYIKKAINHVSSDKIPYLLQITRNANAKYGDMLLKDYYNKDIMSAYEKILFLNVMQYIFLLEITQ